MPCLQEREVRLRRRRRRSPESCAVRDKSQWPCKPLDRRRQREHVACSLLGLGYAVSTVLKLNRIASASPHSGFESKTPAMSAWQSADEYCVALSWRFSRRQRRTAAMTESLFSWRHPLLTRLITASFPGIQTPHSQ